MMTRKSDYIIVGGGLTGCAIASRLYQNNPSLNILILEAGIDSSGNPNVTTPMGGFALLGTDVDWAYASEPQLNTNNRVHTINAGKTLGGGSVLNYGGWSRADSSDYNQWAKTVGDPRWSYKGMLPFFRKSESYYDSKADSGEHGFEGPIHVTSVSASDPRRRYGLREPIQAAWTELGLKRNPNPSSGSVAGISECLENWYNGQRQPAHLAYGLKGVQVITGAIVHRVLFLEDEAGNQVASAVSLADGRRFEAQKEIILSAGALRTPQILLLSGIGPSETLSMYKIPIMLDSPDVGKNLFDHFALFQIWKLRNPEKGLALGSPLMSDPAFFKGLPCDWAVNEAVPSQILEPALRQDESEMNSNQTANFRSILDPGRCHIETMVVYSPAGVPSIPTDGTYIATSVMLLLPTSRGRLTITSTSPLDPPAIDSNFYATHMDRTSLIHGTRRVLQALLGTSAGNAYVETEAAPPGLPTLTPNSTDAEIDERIRATGVAHAHPTGTAAMGKVVGTDLRVYGTRSLRVADSSVLPVAIGGHPQATLYALAEQAVELIQQDL